MITLAPISQPSPMRRLLLLAAVLLAAILLAACGAPPQAASAPLPGEWAYTSLKGLDPSEGQAPSQDLLAVYLRPGLGAARPSWQVRLDLLDLTPDGDYELWLALDERPGGAQVLPDGQAVPIAWDTLLVIPGRGPLQVLDANGQPAPGRGLRVLRDPVLDTVEVHFQAAQYGPGGQPAPLQVQAFVRAPGSPALADRIGPVRSGGTPPPAAPTLLAFWNTLPAYSPALALRRWDGAHTGPQGGRHGLYNLLRAARGNDATVVLLDLKQPLSLTALDYLGESEWVADLAQDGLMILPEVLPGYPLACTTGAECPPDVPADFAAVHRIRSRTQAQALGLPGSRFVFAPWGVEGSTAAQIVFTPVETQAGDALRPTPAQRAGGQVRIALPLDPQPPVQLGRDGPSLDVRRALVATALSPQTDLLVLGGDLPATAWGIPVDARVALRYFDRHPWVNLLDAQELAAFPVDRSAARDAGGQDARATGTGVDARLAGLQTRPGTSLEQAAFDAAQALFAPVYPTPSELPVLRAQYLGQLPALRAAQTWAQNPQTVNDCAGDPDSDGRPECVLASETVWALVDPQGGALVYLFVRLEGAVHQVVGPSFQFASGLSPAENWNLTGGATFADPAVIPGGFGEYDPMRPAHVPEMYTYAQSGERLHLESPDGRRLDYRLLSDGLQVQMVDGSQSRAVLPLAVDPWRRTQPDWAGQYAAAERPGGLSWSLAGAPGEPGLTVDVQTGANWILQDFLGTRRFLGSPEDPNIDYPPGHYLPFPLAVIELSGPSPMTVEVRVR